MRSLETPKENTWCSGCGNFGILSAFKKSLGLLETDGIPLSDVVITCGIGCHGKIFDYLNISGFYGLHGRALCLAQGIKIANPKLQVVTFGGDGDSLGEGLEHTMFAAKRNADVTLILHNNGTYGLTTGQFSPLSERGYRGLSTPSGNIETPFNALGLMLEAGATFIARTYSAKPDHLAETIRAAVLHRGFSFVEVLQPCVSYNNTYQQYNQRVKMLDVVPKDDIQALILARETENIYLGVFKTVEKPIFSGELYRDSNPVMDSTAAQERRRRIVDLLERE